MKSGKISLCLLLIVLSATLCRAQLNFDYTAGKFLLTGMVTDVESKNPVPSVNIHINGNARGVTGSSDGIFSLYVSRKDTLKFTSTGYMPKVIHIADLDSAHCCTIQVEMLRDFIKLMPVTIYPFHDKNEFKKAFIDARDLHKVIIPGLPTGKWKGGISKPKLYNPVSYFYELLRSKRNNADPNFKP